MSADSLDQKVAALESDVQNLSRNMGRLTEAVQALSDKFSQANSTNWSVLAAWSAVIISILGGLGYLALTPLQRGFYQVEQRFYLHEHNGGHEEMKIKVHALKERVQAIENEQRSRTHKVYRK